MTADFGDGGADELVVAAVHDVEAIAPERHSQDLAVAPPVRPLLGTERRRRHESLRRLRARGSRCGRGVALASPRTASVTIDDARVRPSSRAPRPASGAAPATQRRGRGGRCGQHDGVGGLAVDAPAVAVALDRRYRLARCARRAPPARPRSAAAVGERLHARRRGVEDRAAAAAGCACAPIGRPSRRLRWPSASSASWGTMARLKRSVSAA